MTYPRTNSPSLARYSRQRLTHSGCPHRCVVPEAMRTMALRAGKRTPQTGHDPARAANLTVAMSQIVTQTCTGHQHLGLKVGVDH